MGGIIMREFNEIFDKKGFIKAIKEARKRQEENESLWEEVTLIERAETGRYKIKEALYLLEGREISEEEWNVNSNYYLDHWFEVVLPTFVSIINEEMNDALKKNERLDINGEHFDIIVSLVNEDNMGGWL
jgi:hypothetical protein